MNNEKETILVENPNVEVAANNQQEVISEERKLRYFVQKKKIKANKVKNNLATAGVYFILIIFAIIFIFPFLIALSASLTSPQNIFEFSLIPNPIDIGNYYQFFYENDVLQAFINTFLYVVPPVIIGLFFSTLAAYALARLKFKGSGVIFTIMIATMAIPGIIILMPSFSLFVNVYKWYGTPLPIIIPGLFGSVGVMFYLYQYFKTLPKELEEAAEIDGVSRIGTFFRIILPISFPALVTQLILSFNGAYNDYMTPLLYVGMDPDLFTIQILVKSLSSAQKTNYTLLMAGAMTALVPTLVLYILCQKIFVQGIATSGIKR